MKKTVTAIIDKHIIKALLLSHLPGFFSWLDFEFLEIKIEGENIRFTVCDKE